MNPAWGTPTRVTDPNGKVTSAMLDALGRVTGVWLPGREQGSQSANVTYGYTISAEDRNAVSTSTLGALGSRQTSVQLYDGLLRPTQTQTPSARRNEPGRVVTDTMYDSRGLVRTANSGWFDSGSPSTTFVKPSSVAVPARTSYEYDGAGRVVAEIFELNEREAWRTATSYGGDRVSVDPPQGGTPQTTISDARGRLTELRQFTGAAPTGEYNATTYAYDKAGRLNKVTDAAGNSWTYTFDLRGRQVATTDPDRGASSSTYDDAGQVLTTTDARGITLAYTRDVLGRQTSLREGSATGTVRASWSYDTLAKGQLTSSTRHVGSDEYVTAVTGYDDGYRPLGQSVTVPEAEGELAGTYTTSYTYTLDGQLKTMRLPAAGGMDEETVTTTYDQLSLPRTLSGGLGWGTYVSDAGYSPYGEPLWMDLNNSSADVVTYSYEPGTRRLERVAVQRENEPVRDMDVSYTYDPAGNPTSIVDEGRGLVDAQCFEYDGLRRLVQAWTPSSGDCGAEPTAGGLGGPAPYWFEDAFDVVGNRVSRVVGGSDGSTSFAYAYPAAGGAGAHQVTSVTRTGAQGAGSSSYAYDAAGNTTTRDVAGQGAQSLVWDVEGELAEVTGPGAGSFVYTADGDRLVRRQGGAVTVYLPGGQEVTAGPDGAVDAVRYYGLGGRTVASRTDTSGSSVRSLVSDAQGTAHLAITNTTGQVTRRYTDPYGNPRGQTTPWVGDRGFLDKPVDASGLSAVGARYYDPTLGRFITVDPVMDLTDPAQWHGYSYANNNPITYTDPTGLKPMAIDGGHGLGKRTRATVRSIGRGGGSSVSTGTVAPLPGVSSATTLRIQMTLNRLTGAGAPSMPRMLAQRLGRSSALDSRGAHVMMGVFDNLAPMLLSLNNPAFSSMPASTRRMVEFGEPEGGSGWYNAGLYGTDVIMGAAGGAGFLRGAARGVTRGAPRLISHIAGRLTRTTAKTPAVGDDLLKPGPWARDSVPSSAPDKITQAERDALNPIGDVNGCHSCGATTPGTKSGNWIGDHQPPSRMAGGGPQVLYPHCQTCSNSQGLWIINLLRKGRL